MDGVFRVERRGEVHLWLPQTTVISYYIVTMLHRESELSRLLTSWYMFKTKIH